MSIPRGCARDGIHVLTSRPGFPGERAGHCLEANAEARGTCVVWIYLFVHLFLTWGLWPCGAGARPRAGRWEDGGCRGGPVVAQGICGGSSPKWLALCTQVRHFQRFGLGLQR
jgi:hypothetical protein